MTYQTRQPDDDHAFECRRCGKSEGHTANTCPYSREELLELNPEALVCTACGCVADAASSHYATSCPFRQGAVSKTAMLYALRALTDHSEALRANLAAVAARQIEINIAEAKERARLLELERRPVPVAPQGRRPFSALTNPRAGPGLTFPPPAQTRIVPVSGDQNRSPQSTAETNA